MSSYIRITVFINRIHLNITTTRKRDVTEIYYIADQNKAYAELILWKKQHDTELCNNHIFCTLRLSTLTKFELFKISLLTKIQLIKIDLITKLEFIKIKVKKYLIYSLFPTPYMSMKKTSIKVTEKVKRK